jgi:hypothetical protein
MWHAWDRWETQDFCKKARKLEGKRPLRRPGCSLEDSIGMDLKNIGVRVWIGFIWLRTGTSVKLL